MREGMMTMLATFQAKRDLRWAIAIILILFEIVAWFVLIGVPWHFGLHFTRPICESGKAEHWIDPFHPTSLGGWKTDYDAFALEVIIMASHILIAVAVPIASLAQRSGGQAAGRDRTGQGNLTGFTGVAVGSLRSSWWFSLLAVGGLVFFIGQAIAAFRFGVAWAQGVTKNEFNEVALGALLYDHVNAILYMTLTVGLALASIIGRWMLAGLSCTSFTIFFVWVLLTVGAFIPPFFVSTYWVFWSFDDSQGQKDCEATFGTSGDYEFARVACDIRTGTYIAGIILLLVAALGPTTVGLFDFARVACLPRRRAWVDMPGTNCCALITLFEHSSSALSSVIFSHLILCLHCEQLTGATSSSPPTPSSAPLPTPAASPCSSRSTPRWPCTRPARASARPRATTSTSRRRLVAEATPREKKRGKGRVRIGEKKGR